MSDRACDIDGCGAKHEARGFCHKHYVKWVRQNPTARPAPPRSRPEVRFWAKVLKGQNCWEWQADANRRGYGSFRYQGKIVRAHRYAWYLENGEIPDGMEIDHQCRNTRCVRPEHLKVVSRKQNQENLGLSRANTSGHRGVYWHRRKGKWVAQVGHENHQIYLGAFDDIEDAATVARETRNKLYVNNPSDREGTR